MPSVDTASTPWIIMGILIDDIAFSRHFTKPHPVLRSHCGKWGVGAPSSPSATWRGPETPAGQRPSPWKHDSAHCSWRQEVLLSPAECPLIYSWYPRGHLGAIHRHFLVGDVQRAGGWMIRRRGAKFGAGYKAKVKANQHGLAKPQWSRRKTGVAKATCKIKCF